MNAWGYELYLSGEQEAPERTVNDVFTILEAAGYSPQNNVTGKLEVITKDGMDFPQLEDRSEAVDFLLKEGGGLTFWKGDKWDFVDIFLSITLHNKERLPRISVSLENAYFHNEEPNRVETSEDILQIYVQLCKLLNPVYGFVADENTLDQFWPRIAKLEECIARLSKPPVLFWLNYFSNDYLSVLDRDVFVRLGGRITQLPAGVMVSFVDYPWEVQIAELVSINNIWGDFC
jgi:hypothetical protein